MFDHVVSDADGNTARAENHPGTPNQSNEKLVTGEQSTPSEQNVQNEQATVESTDAAAFAALGLAQPIVAALTRLGYETPSPIQGKCIPVLLEGHDLLGMAQTGTGKTAAFALPILQKIDLSLKAPQALILTPTRELAIQVAEALQSYAHHMNGFHVLPVYGGQAYGIQLKQLARGAHVIVGTPGRVMDHLERKTLNLEHLNTLILDEADEMLKMGFIDDVEWILDHTPAEHQSALFSATMPEEIRRVAQKYLHDAREIRIKAATATVAAIQQTYWQVSGLHKLDALTRILEVEDDLDAALIFVRTKTATVELADKLCARGYTAAALNGDLNQAMRERVIEQIKNGALDIVIATDVAARGLDVPRISHVINYDIPYDTEAYVHRIGRTGRAGRSGHAILFVAPRETRMLRAIERATRQAITPLTLPSRADVTMRRVAGFKEKVAEVQEKQDLAFFQSLVRDMVSENEEADLTSIAAALAFMAQEARPLQIVGEDPPPRRWQEDRGERGERDNRFGRDRGERGERGERNRERFGRERQERHERGERGERSERHERGERFESRGERGDYGNGERSERRPERYAGDMVRYRIDVGRVHGVQVRDIVGAIANESGLESRFIGRIGLYEESSTIELPAGMPKEAAQALKRTRVRGVPINMRVDEGGQRNKFSR